jgi:hypothetical protein
VAFAPDGRTLAAATERGTVLLWETTTGEERRRFTGGSCVCYSPDGRLLACGSTQGTIHLWDVATGREVRVLSGHRGAITALAFQADGRLLASASTDCTVLLWGANALAGPRRPAPTHLSAQELEHLWSDLAAADATRADWAVRRLSAAPELAVPFLRTRLRPAAVEAQQLQQWLADLDSDHYPVREQAHVELEKLGDLARVVLRRTLEGDPSLEVRRRVERLLEALDRPVPALVIVRGLRALEALEQTATSEAKEVLSALAQGAPEARLTQEAQAAAERLTRRLQER